MLTAALQVLPQGDDFLGQFLGCHTAPHAALGARGCGAWVGFRVDLPARVAVGLVGTPSDAFGVAHPGGFACGEHRFAKALIGLHERFVKRLGKQSGRRVFNRPTGHHHCAHAHLDELTRHAVSQLVEGHWLTLHLAQMTAVHEDQIGHHFHGVNLGGRDQQAVRQHHAAAHAAVRGALLKQAVARNVNNAVGVLVKAVDDVDGALALAYGALNLEALTHQHMAHQNCFLFGRAQIVERAW